MAQIRTCFLNCASIFCSAKICHVLTVNQIDILVTAIHMDCCKEKFQESMLPKITVVQKGSKTVLPSQQEIILMLLLLHAINLVLFGHEQAHGKNQIHDVQRKYCIPFPITTILSKYILLRTEYFRQYHWFKIFTLIFLNFRIWKIQYHFCTPLVPSALYATVMCFFLQVNVL